MLVHSFHTPVIKTFILLGLLFFLPPEELTTQQVKIAGSDISFHAADVLFSQLNCSDLNYDAFQYALEGMQWLDSKGQVNKNGLVCIIDYSIPSSEKRLFIIDIRQPTVLYKTLVAHGKSSGANEAKRFSNQMGSHQSCLGFFTTGSTYMGQNGYSLVLNGLDTAFNEKARPRAIVMHGADYVSEEYILKYGRIGRSFGCPALPMETCQEIIDVIKDGVVIFGYFPDMEYFERSRIIRALEESGTERGLLPVVKPA